MNNVIKRIFIEHTLADILHQALPDVEQLVMSEDGNAVKIIFVGNGSKLVNIECNSLAAIIVDVTTKAMY